MKEKQKNKNANMRLIKRILDLNDGKYSVDTSKGTFTITKKCKSDYESRHYEKEETIIIRDADGKLFSKYYYEEERGDWLDRKVEKEIDFNYNFPLGYGYTIDNNGDKIKIFKNKEHTEYYVIRDLCIKNEKKKELAYFEDDDKEEIFSDGVLSIDIKTFDRIIEINGKEVKIPKDKDLEEELNKYMSKLEKLRELAEDDYLKKFINSDLLKFKLKGNIEIIDLKEREKKLRKLYNLYIEAMIVLDYTHDLDIMREIILKLNPKLNKVDRYIPNYLGPSSYIRRDLDQKLRELKCGIYFIPTSQGQIQIDIFKDGTKLYEISNEKGKIIEKIKNPALTDEIIQHLDVILQTQKEEDEKREKENIQKEIKRLTKKLNKL